jgi:molecular chaperone DnaK (HSP70)
MMLAAALLLCCLCPAASASGALGIDVGSSSSVIAIARRGGVDVVSNEATRRQTPSVVAFDERRRYMGESASALRSSRPRGCVAESKALLAGRGAASAVEVDYLGSTRELSPVQIYAMLLHHLRTTAEREHASPLPECALAVPAHYGAEQRRAVLDAVEVAGMRCVRLISDGAAAALDYVMGRRAELPADADRCVAFVDAGASGVQVAVVRMRQDRLQLLSHAHAEGAGGAALDEALAARFGAQFEAEAGADPLAQPRAAVRLRQACEKLRRTLSANKEASVSLDCLVGEAGLQCSLTRAELEAMAAPLLARVGEACARALAGAGVPPADLHAVEMVGGFSRSPGWCQRLPALREDRAPGPASKGFGLAYASQGAASAAMRLGLPSAAPREPLRR